MKGLRKYIAPFAPDQSGAAAVFCELGAMVIILDAGGCAGNICGFDEPRWFDSRSAIFSAGLRDMDAILGRDERLVEKVEKACRRLDCSFVALIGTPVPSVIGTDYRALARMITRKTGMKVIAVDTNGMETYDAGLAKAWTAVFETFCEARDSLPGSVGVLGATPLDVTPPPGSWFLSRTALLHQTRDYGTWLREHYMSKGFSQVLSFCLGSGLDEIRKAGQVEKNLVIAPSALPAARALKKRFDIPYEADYPLETLPGWEAMEEHFPSMKGKKILIVHQQILADSLRRRILSMADARVTVASWFIMDQEYLQPGDTWIREEDQWISFVSEGKYDVIIGDPLLAAALPDYEGQWLGIDHFAVSGKRDQI